MSETKKLKIDWADLGMAMDSWRAEGSSPQPRVDDIGVISSGASEVVDLSVELC